MGSCMLYVPVPGCPCAQILYTATPISTSRTSSDASLPIIVAVNIILVCMKMERERDVQLLELRVN